MKTVALPKITAESAEQEPADDRLFAEPLPPPPYPAIELETMVSYEGFTFRVVFRDTSIAAAAEVLKKRGCVPAGAGLPASQATNGHAPMLSEPPMCPQHAPRKMKPMKHSQGKAIRGCVPSSTTPATTVSSAPSQWYNRHLAPCGLPGALYYSPKRDNPYTVRFIPDRSCGVSPLPDRAIRCHNRIYTRAPRIPFAWCSS